MSDSGASLTQEQADLASLSKELKESAVREMIAAAKVDMHEAKIVTLTREIEAKEDLYVGCSTWRGGDIDPSTLGCVSSTRK
jgi:hypothetical protein